MILYLSEIVDVDENGEQAVISMMSKLLLDRQPQRNSTKSPSRFIKSMKIEVTYEIDPNWMSDKLPFPIEVKDRQMIKEKRRKKRSVRDKNDDLELALRIPAKYIVVVVSSCSK